MFPADSWRAVPTTLYFDSLSENKIVCLLKHDIIRPVAEFFVASFFTVKVATPSQRLNARRTWLEPSDITALCTGTIFQVNHACRLNKEIW